MIFGKQVRETPCVLNVGSSKVNLAGQFDTSCSCTCDVSTCIYERCLCVAGCNYLSNGHHVNYPSILITRHAITVTDVFPECSVLFIRRLPQNRAGKNTLRT